MRVNCELCHEPIDPPDLYVPVRRHIPNAVIFRPESDRGIHITCFALSDNG
jgi:hypothetical protein